MSNLVCRILSHYGAMVSASIAAIGLCVAAWSAVADERPSFCVLVPHFKDEYWLSVGYGLEQEATRRGVDLLLFEAGGYRALDRQIEQLYSCAERGVTAILIGAVSSDHPSLIEAIADVAGETPVFGLVNELHTEALSGRIGVDWRDMGGVLGQYLAELNPKGSPSKTAVLISGPSEAGWTGPLEAGLRNGLASGEVSVLGVFEADTGLRQQLSLLEQALERFPDVDFVIGSAPAIEAAMGWYSVRTDQDPPLLFSTYISHTIKRGLMNGSVIAAPFDDPALQGIMAIRMAVSGSAIAEDAVPIGPVIVLLTQATEGLERIRVSPANYFPIIQ